MNYVIRNLEKQVLTAARAFPAVVVTGARRTGKTWMLRHLFQKSS
jgi:predicted AAA+ superfamily ATPase